MQYPCGKKPGLPSPAFSFLIMGLQILEMITPSPISLLALRSVTYGYCPIEVSPDMVNKGRCSDFGEGIEMIDMINLLREDIRELWKTSAEIFNAVYVHDKGSSGCGSCLPPKCLAQVAILKHKPGLSCLVFSLYQTGHFDGIYCHNPREWISNVSLQFQQVPGDSVKPKAEILFCDLSQPLKYS